MPQLVSVLKFFLRRAVPQTQFATARFRPFGRKTKIFPPFDFLRRHLFRSNAMTNTVHPTQRNSVPLNRAREQSLSVSEVLARFNVSQQANQQSRTAFPGSEMDLDCDPLMMVSKPLQASF